MAFHLLCLALLLGQPGNGPSAFIDAELAIRWQKEKLTPAEKTSDQEFLRRVSLDLIGRIPTLQEQEAYLQDAAKDRRRLLVDRLLAQDDFARHWADKWSDWLLGWAAPAEAWDPFHGWLHQHFAKNRSHKELAEKLLLARGTTADNPAVHLYVRLRGEPVPEKDWEKWGQYEMVPFTGHVFRVFHAYRLQCVQCHDNPGDGDVRQEAFQAMNLLFRQVRFTPKPGAGKKSDIEISDDPALNKSGLSPYERRNGLLLFTTPGFYGSLWTKKTNQTRREFFAERFVKHADFARGHVSLMWDYFFGHGLHRTLDFDDMTPANPIVHPKIMDRLAAEFVKSGHDTKALMRWICNSEAYGLKSVANKSNAGPEQAVFFSRMQVRTLTRRQVAESLAVALSGEDYLKRRAKLRAELLAEFTPETIPPASHCELEPLNPEADLSVRQALWLMNGSVIERELVSPQGPVARAVKKYGASPEGLKKVIPHIFAITLGRPPTAREMETLTDPKTAQFRAGKQQADAPAFWTSYYEDLFWALLNSNEFTLNH
jgi:hypothetical protein